MKIKLCLVIISVFVLSSCANMATEVGVNQSPSKIKLHAQQGILFAGFEGKGDIKSMKFDISTLAGDNVASLQLTAKDQARMYVLPAGEYYISEMQLTGADDIPLTYKFYDTFFHIYPETTTYVGHIKISLLEPEDNAVNRSLGMQKSAFLSGRNHFESDEKEFLAKYHKLPAYPMREIVLGNFSEEMKRDVIDANDKAFLKKIRIPRSTITIHALDALTTKNKEQIGQYADSEWYLVRWGAALNRNASMVILKKLLNDTSDDVKHAAEKQFKAKRGKKVNNISRRGKAEMKKLLSDNSNKSSNKSSKKTSNSAATKASTQSAHILTGSQIKKLFTTGLKLLAKSPHHPDYTITLESYGYAARYCEACNLSNADGQMKINSGAGQVCFGWFKATYPTSGCFTVEAVNRNVVWLHLVGGDKVTKYRLEH
ncbi:MAG: hypothetical protein P8047_14615 [Gammaproteobacteria bacterium]